MVSIPFDLKKLLFLPYLLSKLCYEVYLVDVPDVRSGSLDFSASFHLLTAPKKWVSCLFSYFLCLFLV